MKPSTPSQLRAPSRDGARSRNQQGSVLLFLVVLIAAAAGAWKLGLFDSVLGGEEEVLIEGAPVRRGDLRISEIVRGNLEATDSISIKSELEGRSTIIFLAEEGVSVNEGDLIVELDVSQLEDDLVRQEIAVKGAEAAFTKAREQYDIQVIQNQSDVADADLALELAELDLAKYVGVPASKVDDGTLDDDDLSTKGSMGEYANEEAKAEETVLLREEDLKRAVTELEWSDKLLEQGFVQKSENDAKHLAQQRAEIQLTQAKRELDLMKQFTYLRTLKELNADIETRKRDIEKVKKQALARLADFEAERDSAEYKLERERDQLMELRQQVGKAKIHAPAAGLLVYAREQSRWGSGDSVKEGDEVRERQELCTIPRAGGMTVKASIHETKLKKIQTGQTCIVTVDAFPGRSFEGRVEFVAVMADSGSWRSNPNQRLYKADISLVEPTKDMRPGMSCSVEILVEDLKDVCYVPRQCVLLDGGDTIVFVVDGGTLERRSVKVGLDNSKWVSIEEGLKEGEVVALAPPANFEPAPVPESEALGFGMEGMGGASGAPSASPSGRPSGRPSGAPAGMSGGGGGKPSGASGRPGGGGGGRPGGSGGGRPQGDRSSGGGAGKSAPAAGDSGKDS
ncbi:macrolide transporter subunit MacA [Planctomycetes bacterium Poly30]|uniref:Macrolide transporter subunit MacA n=1 Tax=Saltatorellus ferox TaxID=2528018 RepID=A0A518EW72_9BACT|nr:macrolide transporter subunit MacA [Planctomycetes bacterium Poly30]